MIESKAMKVVAAICVSVALVVAILLLAFSGSGGSGGTVSQYAARLFGEDAIAIDIEVDPNEWQEFLDNANARTYISVDVTVNGQRYSQVGLRTKGNASLTSVSGSTSPDRYSLRLKFDEYIAGQNCYGLETLVLNNLIADTTYMKEYLSQDLMRYIGVEAPLENYANITVNGEGFGFYLAIEAYSDSYQERVYQESSGNLYNVKTMNMGGEKAGGGAMQQPPEGRQVNQGERVNQGEQVTQQPKTALAGDAANAAQGKASGRMRGGGMGGGASGGTLQYTDDAITSYSAIFDNAVGNVSDADKQKVVTALAALESGEDIESYFDVDEILRYFAAHTVVVSLDSYYSNMAQNYVLQERAGVVSILPWDYHLSYGAFQSGSSSDVVNFPIDTPVSGVELSERPLLAKLLENETYLALYHQYLQEIVTGYFESGLFESRVRTLAAKIGPYVESDPSAFYSYEEFLVGVEELIELNLLRAESIKGQLAGSIPSTTQGQAAQPDALLDASAIDMTLLGSSHMGSERGKGQSREAGATVAAGEGRSPDGGMAAMGQPPDGMPEMDAGMTMPGANTRSSAQNNTALAMLVLVGMTLLATLLAARVRRRY